MNVSLEEYEEFANLIGLEAVKKDGVFKYYNKEDGSFLGPYELGELYRIYYQRFADGVEYCANKFEFNCMKNHISKDELPKAFKETLDSERTYIETLRNKVK